MPTTRHIRRTHPGRTRRTRPLPAVSTRPIRRTHPGRTRRPPWPNPPGPPPFWPPPLPPTRPGHRRCRCCDSAVRSHPGPTLALLSPRVHLIAELPPALVDRLGEGLDLRLLGILDLQLALDGRVLDQIQDRATGSDRSARSASSTGARRGLSGPVAGRSRSRRGLKGPPRSPRRPGGCESETSSTPRSSGLLSFVATLSIAYRLRASLTASEGARGPPRSPVGCSRSTRPPLYLILCTQSEGQELTPKTGGTPERRRRTEGASRPGGLAGREKGAQLESPTNCPRFPPPFFPKPRRHLEDVQLGRPLRLAVGGEQVDRLGDEAGVVGGDGMTKRGREPISFNRLPTPFRAFATPFRALAWLRRPCDRVFSSSRARRTTAHRSCVSPRIGRCECRPCLLRSPCPRESGTNRSPGLGQPLDDNEFITLSR